MSLVDDLRMYSRFAWGLRGYLSQRMTLDEAQGIVRRRLVEREANFLRWVERGIFGYPHSPYLPLLKLAGCEWGDIQALVRDKGLEDTLRMLRAAGVYITFEEFKGRQPVVRSGQTFAIQPRDFDNPFLSHYYQAETGGTTGAGARVSIDLDHLSARVPHSVIAYTAHGVLGVPMAMWRGILPDSTGINQMLLAALFGQVPQRWFTPLTNRTVRPALKHRVATAYIVSVGRLAGAPLPWPEVVSLEQAGVIARWAAQTVRLNGAALIRTGVSMAVRVSQAALQDGLDLTGVTFMGGTEPPTEAKVQAIRQSGARHIPVYSSTDIGHIGFGCAHPLDTNDLHLQRDYLALIQAPRDVPGTGIQVDAFYYTTLSATAPKLMLNVESDDYGVIETRDCGCLLGKIGLTDHLRHIRSFSKLTGEGVTLVGSEMLHVLEQVLPSRFGGSPLDYQLQEVEDERGFTRLNLVIDPSVAIADESAVIETVLAALTQASPSAHLASGLWREAGTLRVVRQAPVWTARGKLNPLHLKRGS